ncbi:MAG: kelch repeat-containing protein [Candidatus Acidiferrales bacterium]
MPQKGLRLAVLLLAVRVLSGCGASGGGSPTGVSPAVAAVDLPSSLAPIAVSGTELIMATAKDSGGNIISGATFNWASSNPSVATINAGSGTAMGLLPGTTQITASANGVTSAPVTLTVTPGFLNIETLVNARALTSITMLDNGLALVAAGMNSGGILNTAELYNPATATFNLTGNLNTPRYDHTATLLDNGMVLIAGGWNAGVIVGSAELYNPSAGTFAPTGNLITARLYHTATHLQNGMVLIAGGSNGSGVIWSSAELYDPTTGVFTPAGSLNVARRLATATLLNDGTVLIAGGFDSSGVALASAEIYDPETGTFTLTGSLGTARAAHTAVLLNGGMVLIAGGSPSDASGEVPLSSAELYNPASGTFSPTGSLNAARTVASATLLNNGTVLVAGGGGPGSPNLTPLTSAEIYDPAAGTFSTTGSLNVPHDTQAALLLPNGFVLFAGNYDLPTQKAPAELYEPATFTPPGLQSISVSPASSTVSPGAYQQYIATGTFTGGATQLLAAVAWSSSDTTTSQVSNDASNTGASMAVGSPTSITPVTITAAAGAVSGTATLNVRPTGFVETGSLTIQREDFYLVQLRNGLVLAVDGGETAPGDPAELYDPATGTFSFTGIPISQRFDFTATLLENGKVLIAGGLYSGPILASAELYDPSTGTFSATGAMNSPRYNHTATLLVNGTVLITGGRTTGGVPLASAEIYDPDSGTFTLAGTMSVPRSEHTATPIAGGNVLLAGGESSGIAFPANAEVYNAFSGVFSVVGSLNSPRSMHTATLLQNGMVLIAGGLDFSNQFASAELYNPITGLFTVTGSMSTPRTGHSATLLNNGMVLVAGGGNNLGPTTGALASTELFNPVTGTFTLASSMIMPRQSHAATLLNSGMVLFAGGANEFDVVIDEELY